MNIKPIRIDTDYRAALKEVEALMMAEPNKPEGEKLAAAPENLKVTNCSVLL